VSRYDPLAAREQMNLENTATARWRRIEELEEALRAVKLHASGECDCVHKVGNVESFCPGQVVRIVDSVLR
jgi:hypothetical protein